MKKNFFKKLSFVLALAMIVSVIAPAAGAFAASAPKLNSKKQYLHLDKDGSNDFDFNIKNKVSGWKYDWSSANEKVATVKSNGVVTAKGVGTTNVSVVISDKDGEEKAELTATVVVRDNIASLDITGTPADNKLAVGAENDFNRSFTTVSGSTKKTSAVTRWSVDKAGATISDKGVFVATAEGEYTITARAFQSTAKYNSWVADSAKYASYVLATDTYKVTAEVTVESVTLKSLTEVVIKFNAATTVPTGIVVKNETAKYTMAQNGAPVLSTDGTEVTVKTYDAFASGSNYTLTFGGQSYPFTATVGAIDQIILNDQSITAGSAQDIKYTVLDKNGLDVTSLYPLSKFSIASTRAFASNKLTLTNGDVAFVTLSYTVSYDSTGNATKITSRQATITGVNTSYSALESWTIGTGDTIKHFTNMKLSEVLSAKAKKTDGTYTPANYFKFVSLNPSVLVVNYADGTMTPVATGTATVRVEDNSDVNNIKVVEYIQVEVKAEKAITSIAANNYYTLLSNKISDTATVTFTLYDQFSNKIGGTNAPTVTLIEGGGSGVTIPGVTVEGGGTTITDDNMDVTFTANTSTTAKDYRYEVKWSDKTTYIAVSVKAAGNVVSYKVVPSVTTIDAKTKTTDLVKTLTFSVYGVDANGYKSEAVTGSAASTPKITYTITAPDGKDYVDKASSVVTHASLGVAASNLVTISNGINAESATGVYIIKVTVNDNVVYSANFEVTNSRVAPTVSVNKTTIASSSRTLLADIQDAISVNGGSDVGTITGVDYVSYNTNIIANGNASLIATSDVDVYVKSVTVRATDDSHDYTVNVGQNFKIDRP